jgi:hypothetical protein
MTIDFAMALCFTIAYIVVFSIAFISAVSAYRKHG